MTVKGKISRVLLNSCLGCALIVDDVIATLELVRCTSALYLPFSLSNNKIFLETQLQINGVVPQVMVDQSQGLLLYLLAKPSWENISIATSQVPYTLHSIIGHTKNGSRRSTLTFSAK